MKRIRKSTLVPALLLVYLAAMSIMAWPDYQKGVHSSLFYFGVIGATLVVIILLHFVLKRKERTRNKY